MKHQPNHQDEEIDEPQQLEEYGEDDQENSQCIYLSGNQLTNANVLEIISQLTDPDHVLEVDKLFR
jgi:hypothetical protein